MDNSEKVMTVSIEHCVNCHLHSWCSRHDPDKYLYNYQQTTKVLLQLAQEEHYKLIIQQNQIPQHYTTNFFGSSNPYRKLSKQLFALEMASGLIDKFYNTKTLQIVTFPKFGSFEIEIEGILIFSKLSTNKWPNFQKLKQTVKLMMIDHKNGLDLHKYSFKQQQPQEKQQFRIRQQKQTISVSRQSSPKARFNNTIDIFSSPKPHRITKRRINYSKMQDSDKINPEMQSLQAKHIKNQSPYITEFYNPDIEKGSLSPSTIKKLQQLRTKIKSLNAEHPNKNSKNVEVYLQPLYKKKRMLKASLHQPQMNFTFHEDAGQFYKKYKIQQQKSPEEEIEARPANKKKRRLMPIVQKINQFKSNQRQSIDDYGEEFDRESSDLLGQQNRIQSIQRIDLISEKSIESNGKSNISENKSNDFKRQQEQKSHKKKITQNQYDAQYQQLQERMKKNEQEEQLKQQEDHYQENKQQIKQQNENQLVRQQQQIDNKQQHLSQNQLVNLSENNSQQQNNEEIQHQQKKSVEMDFENYNQKDEQIKNLRLSNQQEKQENQQQIQQRNQQKQLFSLEADQNQQQQQLDIQAKVNPTQNAQTNQKAITSQNSNQILIKQSNTGIKNQSKIVEHKDNYLQGLETIDWIGKFAGNQFMLVKKMQVQISKRNLKVVENKEFQIKTQEQQQKNLSIKLQKKYNLVEQNNIKQQIITTNKQNQQQQIVDQLYFTQKHFQKMDSIYWTANFNFTKAQQIEQSKYFIDDIKLWQIRNQQGNVVQYKQQNLKQNQAIKLQTRQPQQNKVPKTQTKPIDFADTLQSVYWLGTFKLQPAHKFVIEKLPVQHI